jgi:hypothetical protein
MLLCWHTVAMLLLFPSVYHQIAGSVLWVVVEERQWTAQNFIIRQPPFQIIWFLPVAIESRSITESLTGCSMSAFPLLVVHLAISSVSSLQSLNLVPKSKCTYTSKLLSCQHHETLSRNMKPVMQTLFPDRSAKGDKKSERQGQINCFTDISAHIESWEKKRSFFYSLHYYLLTYSRSWALLEELSIVQPLRNPAEFHGTRRFNTVFTRALHWSLSWAISIQSLYN